MIFFRFMDSYNFPLSQYLERIGLDGAPKPDEEGLHRLHCAQVFSIPFENIDIHLGRPISLKPDDLVAKLLHRKRGGYCFELNGIFCMALKALGFAVRPHMARVLYGRTSPSERTHEVLIVTISGNKWLADTGFGGPGLRSPIPISIDCDHEQYGEVYRLRRDPDLGLVLQKKTRDLQLDLYAFNEAELTLEADIEMGNHFTSTSPSSIFRLRRICSLSRIWGRITLTDMELSIYRDGQSTSRTLPPGTEYLAALSTNFGINVDADYQDLMPLDECSAPS